MFDQLKPLIGKLCNFSQNKMGFSHPPKLFLKNDSKNSQKPLGRTARYDPNEESITLFVHNRHPKDILRSFSHELVHHAQNLRGDLSPEKCGAMGDNYAQENDHMRNMEKEAYLVGNMCFRDFEDGLEDEDKKLYKIAESKFLKENKQMTTKITKDYLKKTIRKILLEQVNDQALYMLKKYSFSSTGTKLSLTDPTMDRYDSGGNPMPEEAKSYYKNRGDEFNKVQQKANDTTISQFKSKIEPQLAYDDLAKSIQDKGSAVISAELKRLSGQQQKFLKRIGFRDMKQLQKMVGAPVTGVYDSDTNSKIKRFQKLLGFGKDDQDGVFGPATMRKLKASKKSPKQQADDAVEYVGDYVDKLKTPRQHVKDMDKRIKAAGVNTRVPDTQTGNTQVGTGVREQQENKETTMKKINEAKEEASVSMEDLAKIPGGTITAKQLRAIADRLDQSVRVDDDEEGSKWNWDVDDDWDNEPGDDFKDDDRTYDPYLSPQERAEMEEEEREFDRRGGSFFQEENEPLGHKEPVIQTPEQENTLYEQRFTPKNNRLFKKLLKEWTK